MISKLAFSLALLFASIGATSATTYSYDAEIEGMVCAFCAYNVSKWIEALPGVHPGSVDVDLESGLVQFSAGTAIEMEQVSAAFSDTGFSLTGFRVDESAAIGAESTDPAHKLTVSFAPADAARFESILQAIGAVAASNGGKLQVRAPSELEITLLKPLLAGRQLAIQVAFDSTPASVVEVHLLFDATGRQPR